MKENNLMLPSESLSEYERHGFFYIKGLFSKEELQPILDEDVKFSSHKASYPFFERHSSRLFAMLRIRVK